MSGKRLFYLIFFALLIGGFALGMSIAIPGFFKTKIPPISRLKPFRFTTQDGNAFTEKEMLGKIAVVNFFFTTCKSVCPRMNNNLKPVYEAFKNEPAFLLVSHTSDPEVDSPSKLKRYADSMGVNTSKWVFLTGRKDSLYLAARHNYKLDDPNNNLKNPEDEFLHTQLIALVNKKGEVVKIYDGLKPSEIEELKKEVAKLLKDE